MDATMEISREICALCDPSRIILFGQKTHHGSDEIRDISLCVIVDTDDKEYLEGIIYMNVDHDVSFNLLIYTPEEWVRLTQDNLSYAHKIAEKGTMVYVRPL
jgi:hypothetical protein